MATHNRFGTRFWLRLTVGVIVAAGIALIVGGCAGGGGFRLPFFGGRADPDFLGDRGGLSTLFPVLGNSLSTLDWWLGLGAGISTLVGVWKLLPLPTTDLKGGVISIGIGIALVAVNALVAVILPAAFYLAVIATACVAAVVTIRLATGRDLGRHRLGCVLAWLKGTHKAHNVNGDQT